MILLLLAGCISAHADTADTSPESAAVSDSPFCVDWCPDVDGDGLGAPDLACAAVCLPPGSVPTSSACVYVANCSDPEPMVAGHSKPGVRPPVLALTRWKFDARPNLDGDPWYLRDDCDDSDPLLWLWYCYDDDKDGTGDLDSPMPRVCGSVALHPPDEDYHPCPEAP